MATEVIELAPYGGPTGAAWDAMYDSAAHTKGLKKLTQHGGPVDHQLRRIQSYSTQELLVAWHDVYWRGYNYVSRDDPDLKPAEVLRWATVMGIATDKVQLLRGMPTTINASLVDVRHDLAPLAAKLAAVAQAALPAVVVEGHMGSHPGGMGVGMESSTDRVNTQRESSTSTPKPEKRLHTPRKRRKEAPFLPQNPQKG